jgi:hypothetical protein
LTSTGLGRIAVSFRPYVRSFHSGASIISMQCARVHLSAVKALLWSPHSEVVEVLVEGTENVSWPVELKMLDFAAKALKGVARLSQEAVDQINLWKRAREVLGGLMDLAGRSTPGRPAVFSSSFSPSATSRTSMRM